MIIEFLYKDLIIYGEKGNCDYLERMFSNQTIVHTTFLDVPYFVHHSVDMIVLGPMAEPNLDLIVTKLTPYRNQLLDQIEKGATFIAFNNALDILGTKLEVKNEPDHPTLNLFNYKTVRSNKRFSKLAVADFKGMKVLGSIMGFSEYYYEDESQACYQQVAKDSFGFNQQTRKGGFRYKNVFLTEMLGNLFMFNPDLSRLLLKQFNLPTNLPFEEEVIQSYQERLKAWQKDNIF